VILIDAACPVAPGVCPPEGTDGVCVPAGRGGICVGGGVTGGLVTGGVITGGVTGGGGICGPDCGPGPPHVPPEPPVGGVCIKGSAAVYASWINK